MPADWLWRPAAGCEQPAPTARPAVGERRRRAGSGGARRAMSISSSTGGSAGLARAPRSPRCEARAAGNRTGDFAPTSTSGVGRIVAYAPRACQEFSSARSSLMRARTRLAIHRAIALRQHLARGAFLDGDQDLQLAFERAGRRNEVVERVPQRLGRDATPSACRRRRRPTPAARARGSPRCRRPTGRPGRRVTSVIDVAVRLEAALLQHDPEQRVVLVVASPDRRAPGAPRRVPAASGRPAADRAGR